MIPTIISAGALGVSIYCILKVYSLLKSEQEKEQPRSKMLNAIYFFAGFGLIMTLVSLGIEYSRHLMDTSDDSNIVNNLNSIEESGHYSINKFGIPEGIKIKVNDSTIIVLAEALPDSLLKKMNEDKPIDNSKIDGAVIEPTDLLSLGLFHAPDSTATKFQAGVKKDKYLANTYLLNLLGLDLKLDSEKENAIELLTQPELMNNLKQDQYDQLISALEGEMRESPYDFYELAQVYLSRSVGFKTNSDEQVSDWNKSRNNFQEYVNKYNSFDWMKTADRINERNLYYKAKAEIENLDILLSKVNN